MNITYLLEDTDHSGGVRVQLAHADALTARGHRVRIVTKGLPLTWRSSRAEWVYVDDFREYDARGEDFVVGGFWVTVPAAYELAGDRAVHLCQGYEGAFSAYAAIRDQIDAAYSLPIPKLVVSKSLIPICERFSSDVTYVGQIVEDEFYRAVTPRESEPPREEPLESVQEFHVALTTAEMTRLMHSCDILIGPNHREEGFGLPAAEAMAAGIPCLLTSIPSYLSFDEIHDYALFAPEENAVELGERLIELLSDSDLRERLRARGREVAEQWRVEHVAGRLEKFFMRER